MYKLHDCFHLPGQGVVSWFLNIAFHVEKSFTIHCCSKSGRGAFYIVNHSAFTWLHKAICLIVSLFWPYTGPEGLQPCYYFKGVFLSPLSPVQV